MKFKSNDQGYCPCCNSLNLDYDKVQFEDNRCYFPFTCKDCNISGEEWYSLDFIGHSIETDEGSIEVIVNTEENNEKN